MICAGIDAGSRAIKAVVRDAGSGKVLATGACDQGVNQDALAARLLDQTLEQAKLTRDDLAGIVATGYGRNAVSCADTAVTEITCHARGVRERAPDARTVVDIGGQDSKLIRLDGDGKVRNFAMNDRCAAGTGRFLEVVASRLEVDIRELGSMAAASREPAAISSMCVVFAETEIIGLLASGAAPEDIVAGVQAAIAARVGAMAGRSVEEPVIFTGGVAMVSGMDTAIAAALGREVRTCEDPRTTGALGAAILAAERKRWRE